MLTQDSATALTCPCNNCSGHIEFDPTLAGQTMQCPHCGLDTKLFVPVRIPAPVAPPVVTKQNAFRLIIGFGLVLTFVLLGAIVYVFSSLLKDKWGQIAQAIGGFGAGVVALVVAAVVFIVAVMWLVFPVTVYFQLRE